MTAGISKAQTSTVKTNRQWFPQCLKKILEKKTNKVALNILEKFVDFICRHLNLFNYNLRAKELSNSKPHVKPKPPKPRTKEQDDHDKITVQSLIRRYTAQMNNKATFVSEFMETHFKEKFVAWEKQEIWDSIMHPKKSQIVQKLIDLWWNLAKDQNKPEDMLKMFAQLEMHLGSADENVDRWKKIKFSFFKESWNEKETEEKEFPPYYKDALAKESKYFKPTMSQNFKESSSVNLKPMTSSQFNFISKEIFHLKRSKNDKLINEMDFEEAGNLLVISSQFELLSVEDACCSRLTELMAKSGLNSDTYESVIDILNDLEVGGNDNFVKTAESYCSRYLQGLKPGKRIQEALKLLKDVPISHLDMPTWITDSDLKVLQENVTKLRSITLNHCKNVTDKGIESISQLPHLESLIVRDTKRITDEGIWKLQNTSLKQLTLDGCPSEGEDFLMYFEDMKALTNVSLNRLPQVTGKWLGDLDKLPALKALNLTGCTGITEQYFFRMLGKLKLESLDVSSCTNFTNACITEIKAMPLEELNLSGCNQLTSECLKDLLEIKTLKVLKLPKQNTLSKEDIAEFVKKFNAQSTYPLSIRMDS